MRTELTNRRSFTQRGRTSLIVQIFHHAFIVNYMCTKSSDIEYWILKE